MRHYTLLVLALLAPLASPAPCRAWGEEGHQITCDIAWSRLSPAVRKEVRNLLEPGEYGTLYRACVWPDSYARTDPSYEWAEKLHFINVPVTATVVKVDKKTCKKQKCVIAAIERFAAELRSKSLPRSQRVEALRFLGHFVGDLHQPLHVSHRDNCGGCKAKPTYDGDASRTIHTIWDTTLIHDHIAATYGTKDWPSPWDDYAYDLGQSIDPTTAATWRANLDPVQWAQESLELAKRTDLFAFQTGDPLPTTYLDDSIDEISQRLQMGGVRLAALLEVIFSGAKLPWEN